MTLLLDVLAVAAAVVFGLVLLAWFLGCPRE
jgi:hypothetical protein